VHSKALGKLWIIEEEEEEKQAWKMARRSALICRNSSMLVYCAGDALIFQMAGYLQAEVLAAVK